MIRRTSMSLLSLCFLFGCTTTGSSEEGLSSRIRSCQSQIIEDEVTGSNLVIVGADGTRAMSVVNSGRPGDRDVDESTVFPVWSMSKPITIVAMMMLHEQGKFEMDDHVADYIPCFADLVVQDGDSTSRHQNRFHRAPHVSPFGMGLLLRMGRRSAQHQFHQKSGATGYDRPHPNQTRFNDLQSYCEACTGAIGLRTLAHDFMYGLNQAILGVLFEVLSGLSFQEYLTQTFSSLWRWWTLRL